MIKKIIIASLLTFIFNASAHAEIEHKIGLKVGIIEQKGTHDLLIGSSKESDPIYSIEYTILASMNNKNEDDNFKLGLNIGFDKAKLTHTLLNQPVDTDYEAIIFAPIFAYSPKKEIDLYVKAGIAIWDATLKYPTMSVSADNLSGNDLMFGVGASYQSPNGAYSGVEYYQFQGEDQGFEVENSIIALRVGYAF